MPVNLLILTYYLHVGMRRVRYDFSLMHQNPLAMVRYPTQITHPTCFKRKRRLRQQKSNSNPIMAR